MISRTLLALGLILSCTVVAADDFVMMTPGQIEWVADDARPGIATAWLYGHTSKPGMYIYRVRFSSGVMSRPHSHDQDRFITVIEGTWYAGTQRAFDPKATVPLQAGSFMIHPAGAVHYDGSRDGEVIVEIRGMGPVTTEFISD